MHLSILHLHFYLYHMYGVVTIDLSAQIFVTLGFESMFEVFDLYLIDPVARLGTLLYRVAYFRLPRDIDAGNPPDRLIS